MEEDQHEQLGAPDSPTQLVHLALSWRSQVSVPRRCTDVMPETDTAACSHCGRDRGDTCRLNQIGADSCLAVDPQSLPAKVSWLDTSGSVLIPADSMIDQLIYLLAG